jgi:hypothetical protein
MELALKEVANAFGMTVHLLIIPSGNGVVIVRAKFLDLRLKFNAFQNYWDANIN